MDQKEKLIQIFIDCISTEEMVDEVFDRICAKNLSSVPKDEELDKMSEERVEEVCRTMLFTNAGFPADDSIEDMPEGNFLASFEKMAQHVYEILLKHQIISPFKRSQHDLSSDWQNAPTKESLRIKEGILKIKEERAQGQIVTGSEPWTQGEKDLISAHIANLPASRRGPPPWTWFPDDSYHELV